MKALKKISQKKKNLERRLEKMSDMDLFFKVFVLGNFVIGITSGALLKFFYLALKYTDYKYLMLFYTVRLCMYFWLVFYAGFSTIAVLKRHKDLPQWVIVSVYAYILLSALCLYFFESFMPFQLLGGYLFQIFYRFF